MKAILEFNLDEGDDKGAHLRAIKSLDMAIALWDMEEYLRRQTKYASDLMPIEVYKNLEEVRDKFREIMSERSIDLDELLK